MFTACLSAITAEAATGLTGDAAKLLSATAATRNRVIITFVMNFIASSRCIKLRFALATKAAIARSNIFCTIVTKPARTFADEGLMRQQMKRRSHYRTALLFLQP